MNGETCFHRVIMDNGLQMDMRDDPFPTSVSAWKGRSLDCAGGATHFGFVYAGDATLSCVAGSFPLRQGMYFAVPGDARIAGGQGLVISRHGYTGLFQIGGPIETTGRLRYIDGCTDTLLISPVVQGDACLNLLHIPPNTKQTQHTHPSLRAGVVVSGRGTCVTPDGTVDLMPGLAFVIPSNSLHSFHTEGEALRVIAFHPDSDFGPTHEDHPMVNRTIIAQPAAGPA